MELDKSQMTHEHLLVAFCTYLLTERLVARNTLSAYRTDLNQFFSFLNQRRLPLQEISSAHIRDFMAHLRQLKTTARSCSRKLSAIKLFFLYLSERHNYTNVAQHILFPTIEKKLPHYLTEQEVEDLLRVTHLDNSRLGLRNRVIIYLLYATGMRISELAQIKHADVNADQATILLQGKGGKERLVPLPETVNTMLRDFLKIIEQEAIKKLITLEYVFSIRYGKKYKPISRQALWYIVQKIWNKTGHVRAISPHMLRHSMATHMLKNGAHLRSLQMILGHESLQTVQVYTHIETSHLRSVYNKKHPRS